MFITIELNGSAWNWSVSSKLDWLLDEVTSLIGYKGFREIHSDEVKDSSSWGNRKVWVIRECNYSSNTAREFCKMTREATFRHWNGDLDSFTRVFKSEYNHMSDHVDLVFRCSCTEKDSMIHILQTYEDFPYVTEAEYNANFQRSIDNANYQINARQEVIDELQRALDIAKKGMEKIASRKVDPFERHSVGYSIDLPLVHRGYSGGDLPYTQLHF